MEHTDGCHITKARTTSTTTMRLEAEPAAKGRDNEGDASLTLLRFFHDVRRPYLPTSKPAAILRSRWDHEKKNYRYVPHSTRIYGHSDRGGYIVLKSCKK